MFRRRKFTANESPKPAQEPTTENEKSSLQNGNLATKNVETINKQNLDNNCNNMLNEFGQQNVVETQQLQEPKAQERTRSPQAHERRVSRTAQEIVAERRRTSLKGAEIVEEATCYRRVSMTGSRTTPSKKKAECGTHVVSKSELWDTGSQHRCSKSHQNKSRVSISQEEGLWRGVFVLFVKF